MQMDFTEGWLLFLLQITTGLGTDVACSLRVIIIPCSFIPVCYPFDPGQLPERWLAGWLAVVDHPSKRGVILRIQSCPEPER